MGVLEGQSCLVLGGAGGIGRAVVQRYLAEGASVAAVDRSIDRVNALSRDFPGPISAGRLIGICADVSTWESCEQVIERTVFEFGSLDVLVSCVGIYDQAITLEDIDPEHLEAAIDETFRVNVGSLLLSVKAALPHLRRSRGRIVLTASFASFQPSGGGVLYTAAKHAVVGVVRQLAYELAPDIRVNAVAPGVAATVMAGLSSLGQTPKNAVLPGTEGALPLGVVPELSDYSAVYALLGSAGQSAAMTGTVIPVDSGLLVRGIVSASSKSP